MCSTLKPFVSQPDLRPALLVQLLPYHHGASLRSDTSRKLPIASPSTRSSSTAMTITVSIKSKTYMCFLLTVSCNKEILLNHNRVNVNTIGHGYRTTPHLIHCKNWSYMAKEPLAQSITTFNLQERSFSSQEIYVAIYFLFSCIETANPTACQARQGILCPKSFSASSRSASSFRPPAPKLNTVVFQLRSRDHNAPQLPFLRLKAVE